MPQGIANLDSRSGLARDLDRITKISPGLAFDVTRLPYIIFHIFFSETCTWPCLVRRHNRHLVLFTTVVIAGDLNNSPFPEPGEGKVPLAILKGDWRLRISRSESH